MSLSELFHAVATAFDGPLDIERAARAALLDHAPTAQWQGPTSALPDDIVAVMKASDAHPSCSQIASTPLPWAPPETSADPLYVAHSSFKASVELLGPDGLVFSDQVRLGLYGFVPDGHYGLRTHPAEEVFVMLAGRCWWKRGDAPYELKRTGERAHHPSMTPHATQTRAGEAFMSAFVWTGDLSTDGYQYSGLPDD